MLGFIIFYIHPVSRLEITIETIEEIARDQGVSLGQAGVLIVRRGFVKL